MMSFRSQPHGPHKHLGMTCLLEVLLVSDKLEKYGRTLGRILLRDGRNVGAEVLKAGLAKPYTGGTRWP